MTPPNVTRPASDYIFPGEQEEPVRDDLRNLAQIAAAWKPISPDPEIQHTFARIEALAMLAVAKLEGGVGAPQQGATK